VQLAEEMIGGAPGTRTGLRWGFSVAVEQQSGESMAVRGSAPLGAWRAEARVCCAELACGMGSRGSADAFKGESWGSRGGAPRERPTRIAAVIAGSSPHPIPGWFLEGKGAGEAGVRARARALDRAGPCARGRSGATCSGNQSSRGGTEGWFGGEDGPA